MIALIGRIEANGYTYSAGGNLYFDVSRFPNYGDLALLKLDDLKAGARIEVDPNKRNPRGFRPPGSPRASSRTRPLTWDSPWGRGYPGWHIECSAMSMKYLGEHFDIHAGGADHVPIHHTNEIAQSEGATGKKWVNYWVHGEFLNFGKLKMSKSSGEFLTLQVLVDRGYEPLDYRYFLLGAHYRSQLAFVYEGLDAARAARKALNERVLGLREKAGTVPLPAAGQLGPAAAKYLESFVEAHDQRPWHARAPSPSSGASSRMARLPPAEAPRCGLRHGSASWVSAWPASRRRQPWPSTPPLAAWADGLVAERAAAKKTRDFARADAIRAELKTRGIILEDGPSGTVWKLQ